MVHINNYEVIDGLYYSENHVWVKIENNTVVIGITDYGQKNLKEIVNVKLPDLGVSINQGDVLGSLETAKAVIDVIAPLSGIVREVNENVISNPSIINEDPYGKGWLIRIVPSNLHEELLKLMDFSKAIKWYKTLT
ncbi:MAG: glycine cleavage system protein H [Candidatus Methanomethylicia archaeon]